MLLAISSVDRKTSLTINGPTRQKVNPRLARSWRSVVRPSIDGQSVDVVRTLRLRTAQWRIFGFRSWVHGQMSNTAGGRAFEGKVAAAAVVAFGIARARC